MKLVDLTGLRFGRLVVLRRSDCAGRAAWVCRCDCGHEVDPITSDNLRRGHTRSCGCLQAENRTTARLTHGNTQGRAKTPEYETWQGMIRRCEKPNHKHYRHYSGRGISVCAAWRSSFVQFLADVGPRPGPEFSIDRINGDGNYEPGNVRWATKSEQSSNRRRMRPVTTEPRDALSCRDAARLVVAEDAHYFPGMPGGTSLARLVRGLATRTGDDHA